MEREQCCRCEALQWREWDYGAAMRMPRYRDTEVLEVGAVYSILELEPTP